MVKIEENPLGHEKAKFDLPHFSKKKINIKMLSIGI